MTYFNKLRIRSLLVIALFSSQVFAQHVSYRSFDHYNDKVAEFERMSDIDSTDIVMLGNSLTEYAGDWSKLLKYGHVKNRGIAGDDAEGIYQRLNQILPRRPKAVFLMVGINDISHGLTASEVFEKCQKVIDKIWAHRRYTKLYVQSILPINETFDQWKNLEGKTDEVAAVNKLLRHYCMRNNITYINLFKDFNRHETNEMRKPLTCDGLHLTPIGYKVWAFRLNRYL